LKTIHLTCVAAKRQISIIEQIVSNLKYCIRVSSVKSMAENPKSNRPMCEGRGPCEHDESCRCRFNPAGTAYYVSVVDGPRFGLLAGPFQTHVEALECVDRAKKEPYRVDPRSVFYAFGTTAMKPGYRKPGKLNDLLGLEMS
jgi:hypothetical protein